jgi:hypothetical protein
MRASRRSFDTLSVSGTCITNSAYLKTQRNDVPPTNSLPTRGSSSMHNLMTYQVGFGSNTNLDCCDCCLELILAFGGSVELPDWS